MRIWLRLWSLQVRRYYLVRLAPQMGRRIKSPTRTRCTQVLQASDSDEPYRHQLHKLLPPLPPTSFFVFICYCIGVFGDVLLLDCGVVSCWVCGLVFCGFMVLFVCVLCVSVWLCDLCLWICEFVNVCALMRSFRVCVLVVCAFGVFVCVCVCVSVCLCVCLCGCVRVCLYASSYSCSR